MSTIRCAIRRGFFALRPCGNPAIAACAQCGRPACAEHSSTPNGTTFCLECQARAGVQQGTPPWQRAVVYDRRMRFHTYYDDNWLFSPANSFDQNDFTPFDSGPPMSPADQPNGFGDGSGDGDGFFDS